MKRPYRQDGPSVAFGSPGSRARPAMVRARRLARWVETVFFSLAVLLSPASSAWADVAPPNLRPCQAMAPGAECRTDRCTPGRCGNLPGLTCPTGDALACLACRRLDAGACEAECARKHEPCFLCIPNDFEKEKAADVERWNDCSSRRSGDFCHTESCEVGICGGCEGSEDRGCCIVPSRATPRASIAAIFVFLVMATGLGLAWRRRKARQGRESPDDARVREK